LTEDLIRIVNGGGTVIGGTYVHPLLIPHIASWASPSFAVRVSKIVNEFFVMEHRREIAEQQKKLEKKDTEIWSLKDTIEEMKEILRNNSIEFKKSVDRMENTLSKTTEELKVTNTILEDTKSELKSNNTILEDTKSELKSTNTILQNTNTKLEDTNIKLKKANVILIKSYKRTGVLLNEVKKISDKLHVSNINRVPPQINPKYGNVFMLLKNPKDETYYTMRRQVMSINSGIRDLKRRGFTEILLSIDTPNAINLVGRSKQDFPKDLAYYNGCIFKLKQNKSIDELICHIKQKNQEKFKV